MYTHINSSRHHKGEHVEAVTTMKNILMMVSIETRGSRMCHSSQTAITSRHFHLQFTFK